jgi:hypothetical protein
MQLADQVNFLGGIKIYDDFCIQKNHARIVKFTH